MLSRKLPQPLVKQYPNVLEILNFNFERWYFELTKLANHNEKFQGFWAQNVTSIVVSEEEMINIVEIHHKVHRALDKNQQGSDFNTLLQESLDCWLWSLKKKLDPVFLENDQPHNTKLYYFTRLGTRSPKDCRGGIPEIFMTSQVVKLLIESDRVFKDIHLYLDNRELLKEHNCYELVLHLVPFRTFQKENELRCFFFKKTLVAITQYDLQLRYPFKSQEYQCVYLLQRLMTMCNGELKQTIPYENFVMDVEISVESNSVYIIEFNPYGKNGTTSPVLFDWIKDEDILYPPLLDGDKDETKLDVIIRFRHELQSRTEQVVVPPLSEQDLQSITLTPFSLKTTGNKESVQTVNLGNGNADSWLSYM